MTIEGVLLAAGWGYSRIWSVQGERLERFRLKNLPDIAPSYLGCPQAGDSLAVRNVGTLLANRGVYALWQGEDGEMVGWTREKHAGAVPSRRDLTSADMIEGWELEVITQAEQRIRAHAMAGREL